ncbi:ParB/RepB/Spo0J family partition protein [Burkholderia cenocepacia]|uniref:ParB/RepB/Spo0J family partition protein n=1 Tax=Burkholderia cenocepacia TaxID=95486 RepID=UPI002B254725|nr:ParB/RepB/Spo0J family partition protein [Burkholderia cenocepacia]MEB2558758.1 ParB/RepB/Spo0J family partition protein [Burkholderia cenocepacia]
MAKDFGNQLKKGKQLDEKMRSYQVASRFDRVESALEGKESLLSDTPVERPDVPDSATFYVETLEREGRVKAIPTTWPIDKIDDNPLNSRKIYDDVKVKARANSIAKDGQMVPALAARHPTDPERLVLIDGQYRKRARLSLKHKELDVKILEGLERIDFWRLARAANNEREQESTLDTAYGFKKLLDEGFAQTEEALASMIGENKSSINKHLALLSLPEPIVDLMASNPSLFGINMAYEITLFRKIVGDEKAIHLVQRVVDEELSFRKVEAIRKSQEKGPRRRNPTARHFKYTRPDGSQMGTIKEWDDGRIQVDLNLGENVASFREKLQEILTADGAKSD